jgi:hypothetical protein
MNIEALAKKMTALAKKIIADKGPVVLFGLLQREKSPDDEWDIVLAAPWVNEHKRESIQYLGDQVRELLSDEEMLGIARLVLFDHDDSVVKAMLKSFKGLSGRFVDVHHQTEGGAVIRRAYIIVPGKATARRPRSRAKRQSQPK